MARITANRLIKRYGAFQAVHGIDFDIADGEFVAILGPSGCGKSSTMRMIAGLESVSEGQILFDGVAVNDVRARDRNVAMSFENYALYAPITVYENIAFPLRSAGKDATEIDRAVRTVAEKMELTTLLGLKPGALSSGQAQRVGLARALVRKPAVFLLDEPISHLDTRHTGPGRPGHGDVGRHDSADGHSARGLLAPRQCLRRRFRGRATDKLPGLQRRE
ncbi:MAG: ABC transporter ATP-binding protein [Rhodobacter sp.]|nr:ABC transporter ATP-binding protein [Rhodobacter sp.]